MLEQIAPVLRRMAQADAATPMASLAWRLEISASLFKLLALLKLRRARLLLLDAGQTIGQVSEQLGYSSVAHFSRQFKRWSGVSPQAFRQQAGTADVG